MLICIGTRSQGSVKVPQRIVMKEPLTAASKSIHEKGDTVKVPEFHKKLHRFCRVVFACFLHAQDLGAWLWGCYALKTRNQKVLGFGLRIRPFQGSRQNNLSEHNNRRYQRQTNKRIIIL